MHTEHATKTLNGLLRGELAAIETYQQALAKVGDGAGSDLLRQLKDEHIAAANELREHIHHHGGKPDQGSGSWGAFAKAVEGAAKVFGNAAALQALKAGEEQGIRDYESALNDKELPAGCHGLISAKLLPRTRGHLPLLDQLKAAH